MEGAIEGALRLKALCFGTGEASSGRREDARERHHLTITTRRCQVDVRARPAGERDRERGMRVVVSGVFAREFRAFSQKNARAQDAGKTAVVGSPAASHADLTLSRRTIIPKPVRRVVLCPHYVSSRHRPYHAHWRRSCKIVSSSPSFMFRSAS